MDWFHMSWILVNRVLANLSGFEIGNRQKLNRLATLSPTICFACPSLGPTSSPTRIPTSTPSEAPSLAPSTAPTVSHMRKEFCCLLAFTNYFACHEFISPRILAFKVFDVSALKSLQEDVAKLMDVPAGYLLHVESNVYLFGF